MVLRTPPSFTRQQVIRYGAVLLVCASVCTALVWLLAPQWWELSAYFWYSIPGNSFILLPHEPAVLYAGTLYDPFLVATVGTMATVPASVVDYQLFKRVFQLKPLIQANQSRISRARPTRLQLAALVDHRGLRIQPHPVLSCPAGGSDDRLPPSAVRDGGGGRAMAPLLPPGVGRRTGCELAELESHLLTRSTP